MANDLIERLREMVRYPHTHFHYADDVQAVTDAITALDRPAPVEMGDACLVELKLDDDCGCPEEEWDTPWGCLHMHLSAGKPSNAVLDNGDEGEREITLTAASVDEARSALFGWAALYDPTRHRLAHSAPKDAGVGSAIRLMQAIREKDSEGKGVTVIVHPNSDWSVLTDAALSAAPSPPAPSEDISAICDGGAA